MNDLQKEVKRLSNLRQNKNKDSSVIERSAQINIWKKSLNLSKRFENKEDSSIAGEIFDGYLSNYEFQSYTDIQNIGDLVFEEVLKEKIQKQINKITSDESNKFIPDKLIQSLHNVEDRIWQLKQKAGIVGKKEQNDLTALQDLEKKFKTYISFNRNEFTCYLGFTCSECGKKDVQPILLRRRVKNFDQLKHPAFSGRFLYNSDIIDDVKSGKITKEMASRYLKTSPAYIDWVISNEHKIIEIDNVSKENIDKFVNNNPNLRNSEEYNKK